MSATSVGRMLGSFWVGYAADHYGDCAIWMVVGVSFIMLWVVLLPIYAGEFCSAQLSRLVRVLHRSRAAPVWHTSLLIHGFPFVCMRLCVATGLHPVSILQLNGDNAITGPSGYSTGCRDVPGVVTTGSDDVEVRPCAKSLAPTPPARGDDSDAYPLRNNMFFCGCARWHAG